MKWWINNIKKEKFKLTKLILVCLISLYCYAPIMKADSADDVISGTANAAGDVIDETVNILKNLTCETQGIGELLSSEFSHTCIPAPFSTFIAAGIVSPVLYPNMMLRLKINDIDLFGVPSTDGTKIQITSPCARQNRIEYNKQKITFGLCNNILLAEATADAVANSAVAIASAALTGSDPWDGIKDSWNIDKSTYHIIYNDKVEGDNDIMFDVGLPVAFPWKIIVDKDRMCVATYGITGLIPVGCKYIKEPFPQSVYSSFMDAPGSKVLNLIDDTGLLSEATDPTTLVQCSSAGSCFNAAYSVAKSPIVISSPLIECIKQMTTKLLVSSDVCSFDDINQVINSPKRETSSLFQFQRNMHRAVTAFLSLYVIMWGLKIILLGDIPPKNEIINFALKIIFVVYFAVGINITPNSNNDYDRMDGMTQWAFPFLLGGISQISDWAMSASPSELCKFSSSEYPSSMSHMAIWDSLDCRVSHYLGLDILSTMMAESQSRSHDFKNFDGLSFPIPPYLYLLIPAIITGQTTLISLALMFPLLIISVSAFMVNATIVCILGIVILGMLAPLFVPMMLFEYTKGYFDSWVKLLISFMLQPLIVATFIITMFSVYDFGFYGTCKYIYQPLNTEDQRVVKAYFIDNNWDNYPDSDSVKGCQNSLGYMLNNPQSLQTGLTGGVGAGGVATGGNPIQNVANTATSYKNLLKDPVANMPVLQYISRFDFLSSLSNPTGMFFQYPSVEFEKVKDIVLSLVTACLVLYLMYNFSAQLTEFAADMTEGVSLSGMGITPQTIFKYGMQAAGAAGKAGAFTKGISKVAGTGAKKVASEVSRGGMKSMAQSATSSAKDKISGGMINKAKDSFSVSSSSNKGSGGVSNNGGENDQNSDSKSQISTASNSSNKEINIKEQPAISNIAQNNIEGKASNFLSKEDLNKKAQDKIANAKTASLPSASKTQKLTAKDSNITERKDSTIEDKLKNSSLANSKKKNGDDGAS